MSRTREALRINRRDHRMATSVRKDKRTWVKESDQDLSYSRDCGSCIEQAVITEYDISIVALA